MVEHDRLGHPIGMGRRVALPAPVLPVRGTQRPARPLAGRERGSGWRSVCSSWRCCTETNRVWTAPAARTTCCRSSTTITRPRRGSDLQRPAGRRFDPDVDRVACHAVAACRARRSGTGLRRCSWRDAPRSRPSSGTSSTTSSGIRWARFPRTCGSTRWRPCRSRCCSCSSSGASRAGWWRGS